MKYAWIDAERNHFELTELCAVLDVSTSGCRAWKREGKPDRKRLADSQMLTLIRSSIDTAARFFPEHTALNILQVLFNRKRPAASIEFEYLRVADPE